METVCLRYFNICGSRQSPDSAYAAVVPKFGVAMLRGEGPMVFGDGRHSCDFTHVDSAVSANLLAARASSSRVSGQVFNVGCGSSATLLEVIRLINAVLETRIRPLFAPVRLGDVRHSCAEIRKAGRLLGYKVRVSLDAGIVPTMEWLRKLN